MVMESSYFFKDFIGGTNSLAERTELFKTSKLRFFKDHFLLSKLRRNDPELVRNQINRMELTTVT